MIKGSIHSLWTHALMVFDFVTLSIFSSRHLMHTSTGSLSVSISSLINVVLPCFEHTFWIWCIPPLAGTKVSYRNTVCQMTLIYFSYKQKHSRGSSFCCLDIYCIFTAGDFIILILLHGTLFAGTIASRTLNSILRDTIVQRITPRYVFSELYLTDKRFTTYNYILS